MSQFTSLTGIVSYLRRIGMSSEHQSYLDANRLLADELVLAGMAYEQAPIDVAAPRGTAPCEPTVFSQYKKLVTQGGAGGVRAEAKLDEDPRSSHRQFSIRIFPDLEIDPLLNLEPTDIVVRKGPWAYRLDFRNELFTVPHPRELTRDGRRMTAHEYGNVVNMLAMYLSEGEPTSQLDQIGTLADGQGLKVSQMTALQREVVLRVLENAAEYRDANTPQLSVTRALDSAKFPQSVESGERASNPLREIAVRIGDTFFTFTFAAESGQPHEFLCEKLVLKTVDGEPRYRREKNRLMRAADLRLLRKILLDEFPHQDDSDSEFLSGCVAWLNKRLGNEISDVST